MASPHDIIVLLHGLAAPRFIMTPLDRHLRRDGFQTLNWGYPSLRGKIEQHGQRLADQLREFERDPGIQTIGLVAHSMGGIVARTALLGQKWPKVSSLVMLGPPNRGSRVAALLAPGLSWCCPPLQQLSDADDSFVNRLPPPEELDVAVIAGRYDRVVAIESTRLPTPHQHRVVPWGHSRMLFRPDVAQCVSTFLREGRFSAAAVDADSTDHREPASRPEVASK